MPIECPSELERVDREIKLNELKHRLGAVDMDISEDCPPEVAEGFINSIERWENAPWTTHIERLRRVGLEAPPPEELDDDQLTAKLWELIEALAEMRTFIESTDHLSDRELYEHLWRDTLHEELKDFARDENSSYHLDLLGGCSEEDIQLLLKYYMDEDQRNHWREEFPDLKIPDHEDPPYDRDRLLPKPTYGGWDDEEQT